MSSTLGAPLGGTTRGGHQGVESCSVFLDHAAELRRWWRNLFSVDGGGGVGLTQRARDHLRAGTTATENVRNGKCAQGQLSKSMLRNPCDLSSQVLLG